MQVELQEVTVRDLVDGYADDGEGGVVGYGRRLDIRPPFQREFVYGDKERNAVVNTLKREYPLNVMYWADRGNGTYEIIDGQQRTISIAQYVHGDFSHEGLYFQNLPSDKRQRLLDYNLMVYVCTGTHSEKLEWFQVINIAGKELSKQELRNAVYSGSWVSDAKRYFSRTGGPAHQIGQHYLKGNPKRQDYLETAIRWASQDNIEDYMGTHQHEPTAEPLWQHYRAVISWIKSCFPKKTPVMKGVRWGPLYYTYRDTVLDPEAIQKEIDRLFADEDVTKQSGIYPYVLTKDEKWLNIRAFPQPIKQRVYQAQGGKCALCEESFNQAQMEADHITPWVEGGKTLEENCQMLCKQCNRRKGAR